MHFHSAVICCFRILTMASLRLLLVSLIHYYYTTLSEWVSLEAMYAGGLFITVMDVIADDMTEA